MIGYCLVEVIGPQDFKDFVDSLNHIHEWASTHGIINFFLLLNYPYKVYGNFIDNYKLLYFETFSNYVFNSYNHYPEKRSTFWNSDSNKKLILTGIPSRINRIYLLSKLWKQSKLENTIWTLFEPFSSRVKRDCRLITKHLSDDEYQDFCDVAFKRLELDPVESLNFELVSLSKLNHFAISKSYFEQTSLSIVCETFFKKGQPQKDLSEKTWRAIYNRHPFIIAGTIGIRKTLEELGFKTFIEYMKYDYDEISDPYARVDAILENAEYFLFNIENNKESINRDIEYNFNKFLELVEQNKKIVSYLQEEFYISTYMLDEVFNATSSLDNKNLSMDIFYELDCKQVKNDDIIYNNSNR